MPRWQPAAGRFFFRTRNVLFPAVFIAVALASLPRAPLGSERADHAMDLAGLAVILAGQALRVAVIGLAYIRRGGSRGRLDADGLVTTGIFAHARHPLYFGNMLVYLGLFVVLNSRAGWLLGVPFFFFAYLALAAAEEAFLEDRFGDAYRDYRARVPRRFIPRLAGLRATLGSMPFNWRRVIVKECGSTFAWSATFLALLAWERLARGNDAGVRAVGRRLAARRPVPDSAGSLHAIILAFALVSALYALVLVLKKSGRLGAR